MKIVKSLHNPIWKWSINFGSLHSGYLALLTEWRMEHFGFCLFSPWDTIFTHILGYGDLEAKKKITFNVQKTKFDLSDFFLGILVSWFHSGLYNNPSFRHESKWSYRNIDHIASFVSFQWFRIRIKIQISYQSQFLAFAVSSAFCVSRSACLLRKPFLTQAKAVAPYFEVDLGFHNVLKLPG